MSSGDVLVLIDEDGRIVEWRRQAEQLFGWSAEEAVGRAVTALVREATADGEGDGTGSRPAARYWSSPCCGALP